jgi:hypothetical protein
MKAGRTIFCVVVLVLLSGLCFAAQGELIPPPALNLPFGSQIVTEGNFSDKDVIGMIKELLPALGTVAKEFSGMAGMLPGGAMNSAVAGSLDKLDLKPLQEAIDGVKNVRFIIANYPLKSDSKSMLAVLDSGAAKAGRFSRMFSDISSGKNVTAVYVQEDNQGYLAYMYNSTSKKIFAGRMIGYLDIPKLTKWAVEMGIQFAKSKPVPQAEPAIKVEPAAPVEPTPAPTPGQ